MRVVAELPHPDCKITIFSMNQKFIIKLEKGIFEQIYKLAELDIPLRCPAVVVSVVIHNAPVLSLSGAGFQGVP